MRCSNRPFHGRRGLIASRREARAQPTLILHYEWNAGRPNETSNKLAKLETDLRDAVRPSAPHAQRYALDLAHLYDGFGEHRGNAN